MNLSIIQDLLGETQMKRPQKISAIADLADLDQVYEMDDDLDALAPQDNSSVTSDPSSDAVVQAAPGKRSTKSSTTSPKRASQPLAGRPLKDRASTKSDIPLPGRNKDVKRTKASENTNRFRKSPGEYIRGKRSAVSC